MTKRSSPAFIATATFDDAPCHFLLGAMNAWTSRSQPHEAIFVFASR